MKIISGKRKRAVAASILLLATFGGLAAALPAGAEDDADSSQAIDRLVEIVDELREIATSDTGDLSEEEVIKAWKLQQERSSLCDSLSASESVDLC